jgi:hypothetical protein
MTLYQKIPTVSARVHPMMIGAAVGVTLLSLVSTAAIVGWLPSNNRAVADYATVSAPVPADAARAPSPTAQKTSRMQKKNQAGLASA